MKNLFKILSYAKDFKGYAGLNILFNLLSILFDVFSIALLMPFLDLLFGKNESDYHAMIKEGLPELSLSVQSITDAFYYHAANYILAHNDLSEGKMNALMWLCGFIFFGVFFKNLFRFLGLYFIAPLRNGVMELLRNKMYHKLLFLPLSYYSEEKKGDIMARISNDAQEIEWSVLTSIEMLFRDPISVIIILIVLLSWSPGLTLCVFILLPITGLMIGSIGKSLKKTSEQGQHKMGQLLSMIEETLSGLRIIKAFNAEKVINDRFQTENNSYKKLMIKMYRKRDLASPLSEFLGVAVLIIIVWYGGKLILHDMELEASKFITYIALFTQLIPPSKSITTAYFNLQKGAASSDRIDKILSAENTIKEPLSARGIDEFKESIVYKDLSFSYGNEKVLNDINLTIEKGKMVALVGSSGGGKSTLADLLPRFYDPQEGAILIDDIDIREYTTKDLRSLLGIVTQESILFNDSVYNNIAFGINDVTQKAVEQAAKIANAHEFIIQMDNGYETNIGDRGGKLSGGQRQRISIARAVLKNPAILILDEATSALDTESERLVQDALNKLMSNRTSLVIAHRLSTIQNADEIVVIDKGIILEKGTHQELLDKNGAYKKLYDLQAFEG